MFIGVSVQPLFAWSCIIVAALLLLVSSLTANWRSLFDASIRSQIFFLGVLFLGGFWSYISIPINDILFVHPALVVTVFLLFGIRLAAAFGGLAVLISHVILELPWLNTGIHFLTNVVPPLIIAKCMLLVVDKLRIKIVFFYTLGVGFVGGMLSMLAIGGMSLTLTWLFQSILVWPLRDYSYLFLLLAFPEGFCNGMLASSLAILRPNLLKTFDDRFYFDGD